MYFVVLYGCENSSLTVREERRLRVFENRVLRRAVGPKRDEVTGEGKKKLHNEELNDLYSSSNIFWAIIWRRMRWAGHVPCMKERRGVYLEDSNIDGRIILRCIFRKWDVGAWTGLSWLSTGTGGGHL